MAQDIDGDLVIMHLGTNEYYGMQSVANRIWQLIAEPTSLGDIVEKLAVEYEADREEVEGDTLEFLQQLLDEGLIEISDATT